MFVTYRPSDDAEREWEFDSSQVKASQAEPVEKSYGKTWDQFLADLMAGGMRARRHLLWMLLCREHSTLRYDDTPDFAAGELEVEMDRDELKLVRDQLAAAGQLDDVVLAHLDKELATAREGSAGKALLNRKDRRTASRSQESSGSARKNSRS